EDAALTARHELARESVARMRREPGVAHAADARGLLESAREGEGRLVLPRDAEGERLEAARDEGRGVRVEDRAREAADLRDLRRELAAPGDGSGEDVVVAVQILRPRVDDEVDP